MSKLNPFVIIATIIVWLSLAHACSVSNSKADGSITVMTIGAPNGATCYVIMQDGQARGGNCQ